MSIIASTSDQVLLVTLYAVRERHPSVEYVEILDAYMAFQEATERYDS